MNFIFSAYPPHPWIQNWELDPRGNGSSRREKGRGSCFRTTDIVGRIEPQLEEPEWSLHIPVPQNSRINLLFNGFCAYLEKRNNEFAAETTVPEAGVLWGRFKGIPDPVLLTTLPVDDSRDFLWIESDTRPALLAVRENHFCLITRAHIYQDAARLANNYLDQDIEAHLANELEQRKGATRLFEEMNHHDALTVISTECMMRALHPAEGNIPLLWSQSGASKTAQFNTNEIFLLATAWRLLDIETAEQLVLCVLKLQASSGSIPVASAPHGIHSILEAPKPLIAQTTELIWKERRDPQLLETIVPLLRRHLQWMLHHFDPKNRGTYNWQNSNELFVPEIYDTDLSTVDLCALLLAEIEALNRLREQSTLYSEQPPYFIDEQEALSQSLQNEFWDAETSSFSRAYVRGRRFELGGFPSFTPLLLKNLPRANRTPIMDRIKAMDFLPGGVELLSWKKAALTDDSFTLEQQAVMLQALKTTDPNGMVLGNYTRLTLHAFVEWHTLSIEKDRALDIVPATAAYILNLQDTHQYRYKPKGKLSEHTLKLLRRLRTDWFEVAVVIITLLAIGSVHWMYKINRTPPPLNVLEASMHTAYVKRDATDTLKACFQIIRHYPESAKTARLYGANIAMLQGDAQTATKLLIPTREASPDSPGPMIALGLAYQLQGNFAEAEKSYSEFSYLFDEIFPELVTEVNQFRRLAHEGFRAPPNWQKIYRFQLMHEL